MFGGPEKDLMVSPVDVLESKSANLAAPYAVGIEQLANRVIAPAHVAVAVNALENFQRLLIGQSTRNRGQLVGAPCRHSAVKWPLNIALM